MLSNGQSGLESLFKTALKTALHLLCPSCKSGFSEGVFTYFGCGRNSTSVHYAGSPSLSEYENVADNCASYFAFPLISRGGRQGSVVCRASACTAGMNWECMLLHTHQHLLLGFTFHDKAFFSRESLPKCGSY